jgi:predicted ATPase
MSINSLQVQNFKCFQKLNLTLGRLALLTGFNATGKSTVLQSLLLLSQSITMQREGRQLLLNGPMVRLGTVGEVLSSYAKERSIVFLIRAEGEVLKWNFTVSGSQARSLAVSSARYELNGRRDSWSGYLGSPPPNIRQTEVFRSLSDLIFLGAGRTSGTDIFPTPDDEDVSHANVGRHGQYAPWLYVRENDTELDEARLHPKERAPTLRRQLDAYLGDLFPGASANASEIANTSKVLLQFRNAGSSEWRRPTNIGYGLMYVFPLLIALLLAKKGQLVVIDSPEAHLHPKGQSNMGVLLARVAAAGVQVVVETHSDHVLNGVRRAVLDSVIDPSSVALHFFAGTSGAQHGVSSPRVDKNGAIDTWPKGFFDQAETDLEKLSGWA